MEPSTKRSRNATEEKTLESQPRKRIFDPDKVLKNVRAKLLLVDKLKSTCDELIKVAGEVMKSEEGTSILQKLNYTAKNLVLMAYLGYRETRIFESAVSMIPKSYGQGNLRNSRICSILNHYRALFNKPMDITESLIEKLLVIQQSEGCDELHETDFLNNLSEKYQEGYAVFLSPPVSECINPLCSKCGAMNSLAPNHSPVNVVVFGFDGPLLGSKLCLRCKYCSTIYNYNKYGKKFQEGERYYDNERELVEITDVVYVSRNMYSFYRCLW